MIIYAIFLAISLIFAWLIFLPIYRDSELPKKQKTAWGVGLALFLVVGSVGVYSIFGTPQIIPALEKRQMRLDELKADISKNYEAAKQDPKNLEAFVSLGDDFMETSQFNAAKNAYKQAILLSGGNPIIIMGYTRAIIAESDGKVTDEAEKSLKMLLIMDDKNYEARYFMILKKLQDSNTGEAIKEMKALYQDLPADSPLKDIIDRQIGRK